jgi:hypothetical protein
VCPAEHQGSHCGRKGLGGSWLFSLPLTKATLVSFSSSLYSKSSRHTTKSGYPSDLITTLLSSLFLTYVKIFKLPALELITKPPL